MAKKRIQKNFHASKQYRYLVRVWLYKNKNRIMLMKKHQRQGLIAFLCIQSYFKCHVKGFDRHDKLVVAQVHQ